MSNFKVTIECNFDSEAQLTSFLGKFQGQAEVKTEHQPGSVQTGKIKALPKAENKPSTDAPEKDKEAVDTSNNNASENNVSDQEQGGGAQTYSLEEVRAFTTGVAQSGKREEVKKIIGKYGANLKSVDPSNYQAIMDETKKLK